MEIAAEAGRYIMSEADQFDASSVSLKGVNDFVTHVDRGSEQLLVTRLGKLIPSAGFVVEENTSTAAGEKYRWIVDPLDGTTNFIHRVHPFAISIALAEDDKILSGVVHEASGREVFHAWEGGGAYLNGKKIKVSSNGTLGSGFIATGFPYNDFTRLQGYLDTLSYLMKNCVGVRRMGAASVDLSYVACGRFEAFFEYGLKQWDIAAGSVIITEAGGMVSDFSGKSDLLTGKEFIASNSLVHPEMLKIISNFMGH